MIDLMMALLAPTSGRVLIDEEDIHDPLYPERLVAWRAAIAHVPQNIYLADILSPKILLSEFLVI